jgi:hypothetical protein
MLELFRFKFTLTKEEKSHALSVCWSDGLPDAFNGNAHHTAIYFRELEEALGQNEKRPGGAIAHNQKEFLSFLVKRVDSIPRGVVAKTEQLVAS